MSFRVSGEKLRRSAAAAVLLAAATSLSGCAGLGASLGDPVTTGAVSRPAAPSNLSQPMPASLGAPPLQVAQTQFIPPENIGGGFAGTSAQPFPTQGTPQPFGTPMVAAPQPPLASVSTQDLPALTTVPSTGTPQAMPALQPIAPAPLAPKALPTGTPANLAVVPGDAYVHVVESGESLYAIARRYNVTAQAIVQANGNLSPDRIGVGQKLIIPNRPDLAGKSAPTGDDATSSPVVTANLTTPAKTPAISDPTLLQSRDEPAPASVVQAAVQTPQPVKMPAQEPAMSGADKFRWPVSGRLLTDFAASKGTGINIDVPEGTSVKAAENGTVIYVGNGVEGYGNLILIRHANGYVSAYAHLKNIAVAKGDVVNRGDGIGVSGMTGSVSRPQLHFELRKGATPVDPVPMLAG